MHVESTGGFWSRLWSALLAMEGQHAEQTDMRLAKIEAELAVTRMKTANGPDTNLAD